MREESISTSIFDLHTVVTNMENQSLQKCSGYEMVSIEEDPFLFSNQLHPLDFSGYSSFNCQWELPIEESIMEIAPLTMESFPTDPMYSSMEIIPTQNTFQGDFYSGWGNEFGVLNEMGNEFEAEKSIVLYNNGNIGGDSGQELMKEKKTKRCREGKVISSNELSREIISRYFYMPITQAAKELNVGLTLLKKRCRELGIPRWPHRKLTSLQTLIKNVQEMGREEGEASGSKITDAVELLEQQRKLMEEMPEVQLEEKTKKLRQACFKANYKKRKLIGMLEWQSSPSSSPYMY